MNGNELTYYQTGYGLVLGQPVEDEALNMLQSIWPIWLASLAEHYTALCNSDPVWLSQCVADIANMPKHLILI